jgi:hypothetical protein
MAMGVKSVQTKALLLQADGYIGLDLFKIRDPYILYVACMPWGTPIGIRTTQEGAEMTCKIADEGADMVQWREQNEKMGFKYSNEGCFVEELPMPTLADIFAINGEPVKNPQKDILLLLEDASWVGDGLVEWHKNHTKEKDNDTDS